MSRANDERQREWLEADGLGGFASGTVAGVRTRRYHAWLLSAERDGSRFVLVNGGDVTVETAAGTWSPSVQDYAEAPAQGGGVATELFDAHPWPRWIHALPDGTRIQSEITAVHGRPEVCLRWRLLTKGKGRVTLRVRPFLSGRDYHAFHHENPAFRFDPEASASGLLFRPYDGVPGVVVGGNGRYHHQPYWYRRFFHAEEAARPEYNSVDAALWYVVAVYEYLEGARARAVVDAVEARLLTPLGLRSLAPVERDYRPAYQGSMRERDSAYHQGTVWPWLMGPFVEAWLRVRGETPAAREEARRFLAPLRAHLEGEGVGHVSEVASAEPPHDAGGCPFQAWSLGELLRIERLLERPATGTARDTGRAVVAMAP